jgi:hypothetical protein
VIRVEKNRIFVLQKLLEMKKLTAYLVLSLLALPVFAQQPQHSETPSPILHSTVFTAQDGLLSINLMDHVFVGYNIVDADAFTPNGGGELSRQRPGPERVSRSVLWLPGRHGLQVAVLLDA